MIQTFFFKFSSMIFTSRVLLKYGPPPKLKFHAADEKSHFGKFLEMAGMTVPHRNLNIFFQGSYEFLENNFGYRILTFLPAQSLSKSSPSLTVSTYVLLIELVSKELNHFGVIAGLFRQIGGHICAILLFLKTFHYKND